MGLCVVRLTETMTALRILADECVTDLKNAEQEFASTGTILDMKERVDKIQALIKKIDYDWERVPGEWDYDKKQAQK